MLEPNFIKFEDSLLSSRYLNLKDSVRTLNLLQTEVRDRIFNKIISGSYAMESRPCVICQGHHFELISERDRHGLPLKYSICINCGLFQANPCLRKRDLDDFYRTSYRDLYHGKELSPSDFFQKEIVRGKGIVQFLRESSVNLEGEGAILDVGCGAGGVLSHFPDRARVGVDFDQSLVSYGRSMGLNLNYGGIFDESYFVGYKKFKLIICSHVLEHLYDVNETLLKIKDLLDKDGYLYVEVPGVQKKIETKMGNDTLKELHIAHIYNFCLTSITNLMAKNGFELVEGENHHPIRAIFRKKQYTEKSDIVNCYQETKAGIQKSEVLYKKMTSRAPFNRIVRGLKKYLVPKKS